MRAALIAALLAAGPLAARARAEDWLASLPDCGAAESPSLPRFALLYPRAGLPALLQAGDTLVARVRLPVALTPPPGVQQARALSGWRAELLGHAWPLSPAPAPAAGGAQPPERHPLDVVDVRPDGASSLIYRASVPIPAWVAPGSYDFALWAPGGQARALLSLRVLAQGAPARLAWIAQEAPPATAAVAALPVDVFVRAPNAAAQASGAAAGPGAAADESAPASVLAAAPVLDPRALVAALRIGDGLWVTARCSPVSPAFEDELATVRATEQRGRVQPAPAAGLGAGWFQQLGDAPRAWPAAAALRVQREGERLRVQPSPDFPGGVAELGLVLAPDGRGVLARGAALTWFAGGEIAPGTAPPPMIARVRVAAGREALLQPVAPGAVLRQVQLVLPARGARSGEPAKLRVRGAPAGSRVAWRLDARRTRFGPTATEAAFVPLGAHRIAALVLAPDGTRRALQAELRVRTAQASACRCGRTPAAGGWWAALSLLHLARRRRAPRGPAKNRRCGRRPE